MIQLIIWGIVLGSIIVLGGIGLTLIWGLTDLFNSAHGDQMTIGAYVTLFGASLLADVAFLQGKVGPFSFSWAVLVAFIPSILVSIAVAIAVDRAVYKPLRKMGATSITRFIAAVGVAWALRGVVYVIWGPDYHFYASGVRPMVKLFGLRMRTDEIFIIIVAWLAVLFTYLFITRAKAGKALRAIADNPELARVAGINTDRMIVLAWAISGTLIALAGTLYGIETQLKPEMGWTFLLPLFAAIILGGQGSITGAALGGLVIGLAQQVSTKWLIPTYKPAVAFMIMVLTLIFRPSGIFGKEGE